MKFCTSCGAQLEAGTKFCPECGQQIGPAPIYVYGQPVNHSFSEPAVSEMEQGVVHIYGEPVSHNFTPPVQTESTLSGTYGETAAPAQQEPVKIPEPVAAPAKPEPAAEPTAVVEQGSYTPPVLPKEKPEKAPRQKKEKSGGKKKSRMGLIAVLVIAVIIGLFSCMGGGDSDDPNLGIYNGITYSYAGFELSAEGDWVELKSGGKADIMLMGEKYSGKWELDGTDLLVTQGGTEYYGTLNGNVMTIDFSGVLYTYEKEGADTPVAEPESMPSAEEIPETQVSEEAVSDTGLHISEMVDYLAISGNMNGVEMNDSAIAQMGGMEIDFNGDGTGTMMMFGQTEEITYDNDAIYRSGIPMEYELDGDYLHLKMSEAIEFTMMVKIKALNRPKDELTPNDLDYWEGDYYGWWVFDNVIEGNADAQGNWWDCCMTLDIFSDGTGYITIWDEEYGKDDPIAQVAVSVSVTNGVARIVSENGDFMGCEVAHADWLFYSDSTGYEDTLGFSAMYEDPENKIDCYFFLRKWGTIWDDVEEKDLPGYYESWYLPLIEDDEVVAPGTIG